MTHALLPGSPAIGAGSPAAPGTGGNACETTDQRGMSRPQGDRCDMGAYEKLVGPAVGGIAEQPDPAVLPLPASSSSGSHTLYAIAAAVTLAIAASGAVAWRRHID